MTVPATLEQLRRRYDRPCLPLEEVRAEWLPHITNVQHLLSEIRAGRIRLRYTKLHSTKGTPVVYLDDLARWLESCNPGNTKPAANQAAMQTTGDTAHE
ncbi:MAG: transcriptional regulator [Pseudomonadales bacterium]|nr:transcriptional regulator [Pseudomonadales bacterium]|tara:strand:+ start:40328 stop:40624 length:297 start_codon:yes stop_codon:yes gene_type:complete